MQRQELVKLLLPTSGLGEGTAEAIVDLFDADLDRLMKATPRQLMEIPGVGPLTSAAVRGRIDFLRKRGIPGPEDDEISHMLKTHQLLHELDDLVVLIDSVGERVLSIMWDTGGGMGGGADGIYRIGESFIHAPDPGIQSWRGPYDSFENAAMGVIYFGTATSGLHCDYPVEDWIHVAEFESDYVADQDSSHEVWINGTAWSLEDLRKLKDRSDRPLPTGSGGGRLDLAKCQAAILDAYRRGETTLKLWQLEDLFEKYEMED